MSSPSIRIVLACGLLSLGTLFVPSTASAADPDDAMAPYRAALHGDLRQFYADRLMLDNDEGEDFWPIYNEYAAAQKALDDRLFMLLQRYANEYKKGPLTDRSAKPLIKEAMEIEQEDWELREEMMKKTRKALSSFKAAKFYQIDNRIRTAARYERALQVPLIN